MNDLSGESARPASSSDRTIFSLLHAAHALEDKLEETLARVGLSTPKFSVLSELVACGEPLSLSQLATRLSCVKSNMTQLVDRLESDGLVQRVDDPADRRSVKASITALGRQKQVAGEAEVARLQEDFASRIGAEDRSAVARMLSALA